MKKTTYNKMLIAIAITSLMFVASCAKEDNSFLSLNQDTVTNGKTRTTQTYVITFDSIGRQYMADTTSYGDNAYAAYSGTKITPYLHTPTNLRFAIKGAGSSSSVNFWDGGFVISDWNYKSNIPGKTGDWWYSYLNQCSVYSGTDGAKNGGYGGSSNFAVMFGYVDSYNQSFGVTRPTLNFTSGNGRINGMYVCLSSYTYGVIEYGNTFGSIGVATPLKDVADGEGYFKLQAYGFNGTTQTTSQPVEIYLAKYNNHLPVVAPVTQWTYFDLSALGNVTRVEFNLVGNDSGAYGLNTPAYVCMDNISVTK